MTRLASGDVELLREVVARRRPELLALVDRLAAGSLSEFDRNALRRAVVDEMCEHLAPGARADRRDLELSDLLLHLSTA